MAANFIDAVHAYANAGRMAGGAVIGAMLRRAAGGVVDTISEGEKASLQAAAGKADLAQVTEAVSNAQIAVQTVVALRDRVVQAYQDIIKMPM